MGLPERVEEALEEPGEAHARSLAFNPWGTLLAAGCTGGTVAVYDWQTRGLAAAWEGGHDASTDVTALLWSADGRTLVSGARDGSLAAWDVATGRPRPLGTLPGGAVVRLAWAAGTQRQPQGQQQGDVLASLAAGPAHLLCLSSGRQQALPLLTPGEPGGRRWLWAYTAMPLRVRALPL